MLVTRPLRLALALALGVLVVGPSAALTPVFSSEGQSGKRDIKVCVLLLQATSWENTEPYFLPTLAGDQFQRVRNLRPSNWNLVNPLAPPVITPNIAKMWDPAAGTLSTPAKIIFDGISADVVNDYSGSGNTAQNEAYYNGGGPAPGNPGGPVTYLCHADPVVMTQIGTGGAGKSGFSALPAVGQPVPKTCPAYWEVPLTAVTVSQLANFDAVFVNTHRNMSFSAQEQVLLQQFLDQGGTLLLEDSHGSRMVVRSGGDKTLPQDTDFFLPFQFVDGFPWSTGGSNGSTRPDGYPINRGGVSTLTPSKTVINPSHPLLNAVQPISVAEADLLGDVRARDHLIIRSSPSIYQVEEVLRTTNTDTRWGQPTGTLEPAVVVARIGSGKLILSGIDAMDDCGKPAETGDEPHADWLPDFKFMLNLIGWKTAAGGDRRGGANNLGVGASASVGNLLPQFVWHEPQSWTADAASFARVVAVTPDAAQLQSDPNYLTKEPLATYNGIVYLQSQAANGDYYLVAVDTSPNVDRDGDGLADDGPIRDMTQFGATSDTLWRLKLDFPIVGATIVTVQHEFKNLPCDVLLITQKVSDRVVRLSAINATVSNAINNKAPVETPGTPFYNWTSASSNWGGTGNGYVDLDCQGRIDFATNAVTNNVSAPVVYSDEVYVTAGTDLDFTLPATPTPPGEWMKTFAVRLVPNPGSGAKAGTVSWTFPDKNYASDRMPNGSPVDFLHPLNLTWFSMAKQVDTYQNAPYPAGGANFIAGTTSPPYENQLEPPDGSAPSPVVRTMKDTTNLRPAVGLARDARTGLVTPTAFINRANGDVWAVSASPFAMGWLIGGEILAAPAPVVSIGGTTLVNGTDVRFIPVKDSNNNIVAMQVLIDPSIFRAQPPYTPVQLAYRLNVYGLGTRDVSEQRLLYPLVRLLRGDRNSGYEGGDGAIDLLGWSTGAPLLWDPTTVVSTSTVLWRGAYQPAGNYSGATGLASVGDGGTPGSGAYQVRASGTVNFFDSSADAQSPTNTNPNQYGAVRWVFDPSNLLREDQSVSVAIDANFGSVPMYPRPQLRRSIGFFGAPVRYGDNLVVAGSIHNAWTNGAGVAGGAILALDPNPTFSATALTPYRRNIPTYLLAVNPTLGTFGDLSLASLPTSSAVTSLRQYVIDPRQYSLDVDPADPTNRLQLSLMPSQAHLTRFAESRPDSQAGSGNEPFPEAERVPLYGRVLWLVQDMNGDGIYNTGDVARAVYVPSPVKWMYMADTILLDVHGIWQLNSIKLSGSSAPLGTGLYHLVNDPTIAGADPMGNGTASDRPLIQLDSSLRGKEIVVDYNDTTGNHTERYVVPSPLPGFSFSPVVAGDKVYIAGTQMGSRSTPAIPTSVGGQVNGGVYTFRYGSRDHIVDRQWLQPNVLPSLPNFNPTGLLGQLVRGIPLAGDGQAFVSFDLLGNGAGTGTDNAKMISPLYALGASDLLVTESQRIARVDYEGNILTQFTGTQSMMGDERPANLVTNNPQSASLDTQAFSGPVKAYNVGSSDHVLVVDTGNNRVVETDASGLITWPLDSRTGHPDGVLRYLGLRDLGLNRPQDAVRFRFNASVHPRSLFDVNGDGTVDANDVVTKDATVIADTGNKRVVMSVSYPVGPRFYDLGNTQSGTYTYFEPLLKTQTGFGDPWALTAPKMWNPTTQQWVELAYSQLQLWDPQANDNDPRYDAANDTHDFYLVTRVDGSDQLYNLDPDPDHDGNFDDRNIGVVDGYETNLGAMTAGGNYKFLDQWSGGMVFRGLRAFRRFRIGQTPYLAVIMDDPARPGTSQVVIYEHVGGATPLVARWAFTRGDYQVQVYDPATTNSGSYYGRQNVVQSLRQYWYGYTNTNTSGTKAWNPTAIMNLPNQNLLAIVNGGANSPNQAAPNSEVLLVRFDPNDLTTKRVDYVLPNLATTSTWPAGQAASQRRPDTGSYPVSSPMFAHQ